LHGNYLYLAQITECLENAIKEVEFYMNGKSAPQPEQVHMDFASEDAALRMQNLRKKRFSYGI
jgi:hypothetical protein